MTDGLKDAHREAITAVIAANDRVERAVLFGSRATGTNSLSSDVDLALFGDRLTLTDQARLAAALDEIPMAQSVDVLLYDSIRDGTLREHINVYGVEWYARRTTKDGESRMMPSASVEDAGQGWLYRPTFPDHWKRSRLYSMARWVNGLAFRNLELSATGKPVIKIAEIKGGISNQTKFTHQTFDDSVRVRSGDLLFSWSGQPETSIDAFWWRGPEGWLNQHVFRVTPADGVDTMFFFYLLRYMKPNFVAIAGNKQTTGLGHVTKRDLKQIVAASPPIREQRTIVHILGTLDDKIELNRRMNATLEAIARALFKSWFVDFDPVRAKMEGRDTGLPKEIADLFPDRLVNSELGDVPIGWGVGTLADHFEAVKGVSYKGSGLGRGGMPLHNLNSVHEGGGYKYEGIKFYGGDYADRHVVRPGDVIVANTEQGHKRLLIGFAAIVPSIFGNQGVCSHHVYRLRPRRTGQLSTRFLQLFLNFPRTQALVSGYANGTTVNMLPIDGVQKPLMSVPPRELIEVFDALALKMELRREHTVLESRALGVVRDMLLPKLVSGELRVNELEPARARDGSPASVGTGGI